MKVSYDWLKSYLPQIPSIEELGDIFTYHLCEVESVEEIDLKGKKDTIFDVNILPNRAHDLLSHYGIAYEIASLLKIDFSDKRIEVENKYKNIESKNTKLEIKIDTDKCRRYMGRIVRNIKIQPSPSHIVNRLESIGQRSINNIVDIANLVMYDTGQPTHAFDLGKLSSEKIIIRQAKEGEKMRTLDERDTIFNSKDMLVTDEKNVLAIAGVKGGKDSGVSDTTDTILIEVANFDPVSVRKTAQRLGIFTDARKRFENNLSPLLTEFGMAQFSTLIQEVCPQAIFEDVIDEYPFKNEFEKERRLKFSSRSVSNILGVEIEKQKIEEILKNYNFEYSIQGEDFEIVVPKMRFDLENEEDMTEEIGRIMGYENVLPILPEINFKPRINEVYSKTSFARKKLIEEGYKEVMTYVFRDSGEREVLESASDKKFLRVNLSDGLKESIKLNQLNAPLLGVDEAKIFEIGTVFLKDKEEIRVAYGDKKNVSEATLDEYCKSNSFSAEESDLKNTDYTQKKSEETQKDLSKKFKMWSLFPFISRDIAVWVPKEESSEELEKILKENSTELLIKEPLIFDTFTKGDRTSYAFRLIFQSYEKTLTDEEVNNIMKKIEEKIKENPHWEIR